MGVTQAERAGVRKLTYRNDSGETIPAYGLIHISEDVVVNGVVYFKGVKWDGGDTEDVFWFNAERDVPDGDLGEAILPVVPQWVLYDDAATPAFQQEWGPVSGSFEIATGGEGFIILGGETDGRVLAVDKRGGCSSRNEKWQLTILGTPTGGTFDLDLTVNGSEETMTFDYNDAASAVETELETHTEIASGDVDVTGGPFPDSTVTIEFQGDLANTAIAPPVIDFSSLTGGSGVGVVLGRFQPGHPN